MTITYVGNRKNRASDGKSFNTENHIALTLEKLGHTVNFIQEDEIEPGTLARRAKGADLFLWTRTWKPTDGVGHVSENDLNALKALGIPTASFHLDKYTGIKRDGGIGVDLFWHTDYVFSPEGSPEAEEIFRQHGINHIYLKPGVFEDECYIETNLAGGEIRTPVYKHEIIFVGGGREYSHPEWNDYRNKLMDCLESYGDKFAKYGWPQQTVRGEELNKLYASTKIVVGDSLCKDFKDTYYWSDRVYETLGRGGFIIHPYIVGLDEEFEDKKTIVYYEYGNWQQLKEKIDYYLEHDEEREAIRIAGHEFVKQNCTYTQRLQQMLYTIFDAKRDQEFSDRVEAEATVATAIKISLGAGTEPEDGYVNVDIVPLEGIQVVHNLMQYPWPFETASASFIKAKDIIEHMATHLPDGRSSLIAFIEECHRILQTGGTLWVQTPSWDADFLWIDPTHVRGYDIRSFDFFDPDTDFGRATGFYSEAKFRVTAERLQNGNLQFELRKRL